MRFQVLLTPLTGVLFTFPSRYLSTIGLLVVFSLTRWSSQIQAGFHVSRLTWVPDQELHFDFGYRTVTLYGPPFQTVRLSKLRSRVIPTGPRNPSWTRVQPVWANPLSLATTNGITACFLFLRVLRCFTSPGLLQCGYGFTTCYGGITRRGFPHSDIHGSKPGWRLPVAYRSHPRPSSPPRA